MIIMKKFDFNSVGGKKGIAMTGDNNIANKVEQVEIEIPVALNKSMTINSKSIGAFTYFSGNCIINKADKIGRACMINRDVIIGLANQSVNSVSSYFIFGEAKCEWLDPFHSISASERKETHQKQRQKEFVRKSTVLIGNDVWIGAGAQILLGVEIGDGAIIGAGSIVTKNVPPYCVAAGNPARIIKKRFSDELIERLCKIKWWEYGIDIMNGLDVTAPEMCVKMMEKRIKNGDIQKYKTEKFVFYKGREYYDHVDSNNQLIRRIHVK